MKISFDIKYFTVEEIACPCCGLMNISHTSIKKIDLMRESLSFPLIINSACRCKKHNREVGGAKNSSHICNVDKKSHAFDIEVKNDSERFLILRKALLVGFHRIGVYEHFIHLDDDISKRPVIWYGK